jgi:hypothetical protein
VLYYDYEAQRQFAREHIAYLAEEARSVNASDDDVETRTSTGLLMWLLQVWPSRKRAPHRAPALRA